VRLAISVVVLALVLASGVLAGGDGILVVPDEEGNFEYVDDFSTPKFLLDAFVRNLGADQWQSGSITNCGPNRRRTLTYRFHGERLISTVEVEVQQTANAGNLGGRNMLYLSLNGLDWRLVANSREQEADHNGWQRDPLTLTPEQAADFIGHTEVWVRVVLDNYCGLKTSTSNIVSQFRVKLSLGESPPLGTDVQASKRAAWGDLRRRAGWRSITLDWADPPDQRAPHYYEDSDGWLQQPGANPNLMTDEADGFPVRCTYTSTKRSPLSLATFVNTPRSRGPLMARITVRASQDSSRKMNVLWDGALLQTFDVASYFDTDKVFFVEVPGPHSAGAHELRIAGGDSGSVLVRQITMAGPSRLTWAEKPKLPENGSLEVLSAYYMPDPEPAADSQAVEGRHKTREAGLIFAGLQRMYKEHADFGAVRVVVRNNGKVPVRIANTLTFNGKPVEESYVDFVTSDWDARGVVWYRVRPRLLEPGQCGQVYIRFRRRPAGHHASVTINLENGKPVKVRISYEKPAMMIDYVSTGKAMDTLYVYVRRSGDTEAGNVTELALDGKIVRDAEIYGADFPGGIALVVARLPRALTPSEYHVVGVRTDSQITTAAQFRVLSWMFPRSSIQVRPELCKETHMNLTMWVEQALETCEEHDIYTTTTKVFDLHPRVAYVMGPDEPDAHDNRGGGYARGLGYHARMLADSGWQELIEHQAPGVPTWIIMNGTTRPLNWGVYRQFADISCFDPYPVNFYAADHAYVRESLDYARQCGTPKRMYACLEAYGWGTRYRTGTRRPPIPAEYRHNVVQAIGCGMKGLTSWVYTGSAGGWALDEAFTQEIAKVNTLIEHIEDDLLLGTPIDLATSDAGLVPTGVVGDEKWPKERVWVGSLLCGPDTIVIAAANHIPASKPDPPTIEPAKDVTITVNLPDFLPQVTALEATEDGLVPFPCTVVDGKAFLKLAAIESGRVFVLRRQ